MSHDSDPVSTTERVAHGLRERILEGALLPGAALREAAIANELDISRNTLRESLRLLASEGLSQSFGALLIYLEDSERQVLDELRRSRSKNKK